MPKSEDNMKDMTNESTQLDELVFKALSEEGGVIPQTVSEVVRAEEHLERHPPEIPESLRDSRQLLERIKARKSERACKVVPFPGNMPSAKVEEELAWAARNCTEITPEIQERMRQNRTKALSQLADPKSV
jgi:hypothetical protein